MTKPALLTALLLLPSLTHAASIGAIGASFLGDDPGGTATWFLAGSDLAGVAPQTNWNNIDCNVANIPPYVGISGPLVDYAGNPTAVQLQFVADDAWNANGPIATPNAKLMKGVLKETPAGSMTLVFTNVPTDTYEVYVYGDVDTGPQSLDVSIGARRATGWSLLLMMMPRGLLRQPILPIPALQLPVITSSSPE